MASEMVGDYDNGSLDLQYLYAIHDSKARRYAAPFPAPNDEFAKRMLRSIMFDKEHDFYRFNEDYQLFQIGYFDCISGSVRPVEVIRPIIGCWVIKAEMKEF